MIQHQSKFIGSCNECSNTHAKQNFPTFIVIVRIPYIGLKNKKGEEKASAYSQVD
jgi:hypothetical protein